MPIRYRIDPQTRMVWTVANGTLTDTELLVHKKLLAADPEFRPDMAQLSDVRGIKRLEVTPEGVRRFVAHDEVYAEGHMLAIVASEDVVFGMARMYQTLSNSNVGVFRTMREALSFLGRPEDLAGEIA